MATWPRVLVEPISCSHCASVMPLEKLVLMVASPEPSDTELASPSQVAAPSMAASWSRYVSL